MTDRKDPPLYVYKPLHVVVGKKGKGAIIRTQLYDNLINFLKYHDTGEDKEEVEIIEITFVLTRFILRNFILHIIPDSSKDSFEIMEIQH